MFELYALITVLSVALLFGLKEKAEWCEPLTVVIVILLLVVEYLKSTKKPTYPNSDGY